MSRKYKDFEDLMRDRKDHKTPKPLKNSSYRDQEVRLVKSVTKEVSGNKALQAELNNFLPTVSNGLLLNRKVICTNDRVTLKFSSPLQVTSAPSYINKWKCEEMVVDSPKQDEGIPSSSFSTSSVTAVKLNWRKGVKVEELSKFSKQVRMVEPEMTNTDFDFESKHKFEKELQSKLQELFPKEDRSDVKILNANESYGKQPLTIKSSQVQRDEEQLVANDDNGGESRSRSYEDKEEHSVILIPVFNKSGFDADLGKRYSFPFHAKFQISTDSDIEKKNLTLKHQFLLRLSPSNSPQHYGLIFRFRTKDNENVITIKSLLTVYSVHPTQPNHGLLVTYKGSAESGDLSKSRRQNYKGQFVKNVQETISSRLDQNKLAASGSMGEEFKIDCGISHPHRRSLGTHRPRPDVERKSKQKAKLVKELKAECRS